MAHSLSLHRTATNFVAAQTITIPGTGYFLEKYALVTPKENDDGTYDNVTEPIDVLFEGASVTAMRTAINDVERFLKDARDRTGYDAGARYYFRFQPSGDSVTWRSEIVTGRLELASDALQAYGQAKSRGRIIITRQPFWEGDLTEVQLASLLDTTPATGGRRIVNHRLESTTNGNYVSVAAAQVTGVLPTPAKIQMKNTSGSTQPYRNWYIANNVFNNPPNMLYVYQGEERQSGFGTVTALASSSGGQYVALTVNTTASIPWDIASVNAERAGGHTFRILMRLAGPPAATMYVTPSIWDKFNVIPLTSFRKEITITTTGSRLVDLGTLRIPPGLGNTIEQAEIVFRLDARSDISTLLNIDYWQMLQTHSFRHLVQRGNTIPNNDSVWDDSIEGVAYSEESLVKHSIYTQLESPVMLWPGKVNQIFFLHDIDSGDAPIATETTIRIYYRPRLLTL